MSCNGCEICEQPLTWEHRTVDGVFVKQMHIQKARTIVPQHSHAYAHTSMLARGSVRVMVEDTFVGDFTAPYPIFVEARKKHQFISLEDDTILYCIHNVSRSGSVEIVEEA